MALFDDRLTPVIITDVDRAVEQLAAGEVVAIPTETVYGLAANLDKPEAIEKIFSLKKRPANDPLIVHVSHLKMAEQLFQNWDQNHAVLADRFWPGPLTMVARKSDSVSDVVTSGLPTVAVRWAKHKKLQRIIEKLGTPVVAPSANMFGKTSPTCAQHVEDEFQGQIEVLDGGACEVGIESTVICLDSGKLEILRPGIISDAALAAVSKMNVDHADSAASPGNMRDHYQTNKPLFIFNEGISEIQLPPEHRDLKMGLEIKLDPDPKTTARKLYSILRDHDKSSADYLYIIKSASAEGFIWQAIWDRLYKASVNH